MKNPRFVEQGAFQMALDTTLNSTSNDMPRSCNARKIRKSFFLCPLTNSVEPIRIRKGTIKYDEA